MLKEKAATECDYHRKVSLRLLVPEERERFDALVESYVDESQYRGTCYRACGFKAVGLTAGYGRSSHDYYEKHGQPKQLYVRELRPRALGILRQGRLPSDLTL